MAIKGFKPAAMVDDDAVSIAAVGACQLDFTWKSRVDRLTHASTDVNALVIAAAHTAGVITVPEMGGDGLAIGWE